jgi:hypothetical protein
LSIACDGEMAPVFDTNETSIMITPMEISKEMPDLQAVGSIFSTATVETSGARTPVDRMAATEAPEKEKVSHAIVIQEEVETPPGLEVRKDPNWAKYINSLEELLNAAREASNKNVDVDVGSARNEREKALLLSQKEKGASMSLPAYVVNEKAGILSINDLGVALHLNTPFNLANLSGSKVAESGELRGLINAGIVRFISPQEAQGFMDKMDDEIVKAPTLDIFDNSAEAMAAASGQSSQNDQHKDILPTDDIQKIELSMDDLDAPTQEESMIINLTENNGSVRESSDGGSRTSVHGSAPSKSNRKNIPTASSMASPNQNPAHNTIKKSR